MPLPRKKKRREASSDLSALPLAKSSELKRIHLFREVPHMVLGNLEGRVRRAVANDSETILELYPSDEPFRYFFFILSGQVKVSGYDEEARVKPLNFLRKGEFFVDKSLHWGGQVATKVVAISHVEILVVPWESVRELSNAYKPFNEKIKALTERIDYRNRTYSEDRYARSVLEFLIDKELTQASRVKITQMDKCIECNTCYDSCEERHGFQRLERGYARFGILDFAQSCITCFYPTCIPACPVDSVIYNSAKGEVEILDSCIGCSACATACQYGAIKMYRANPEDNLYARFFAPGKKIKPKQIADKCNHCAGYDDMVCITNCPTGAIIEVESTELLENPRIFGAAEAGWHELPSLIERNWLERFLQIVYVAVGLCVTLGLFWEAAALKRFPALSFLLYLQAKGIIPSKFGLSFERGSDYCYFIGNVGFTLILISLVYPLRKAFPKLFKYLGKKPYWLDLHNFCGLLGTVFVTFHTGFVFPLQPSTFGYLALVAVMLSGVFGRFLYQMIPRGVAGTELKLRDIEEEDAGITKKMSALLGGETKYREIVNRILSELTSEGSKNPNLWSLVRSVVKSRWLLWRLRFQFPAEVKINQRQIGVFRNLLDEKVRLQRNVAFLAVSSRLFARWQYIHRPFAYVMGAVAIGHVVYNLIFFAGK